MTSLRLLVCFCLLGSFTALAMEEEGGSTPPPAKRLRRPPPTYEESQQKAAEKKASEEKTKEVGTQTTPSTKKEPELHK